MYLCLCSMFMSMKKHRHASESNNNFMHLYLSLLWNTKKAKTEERKKCKRNPKMEYNCQCSRQQYGVFCVWVCLWNKQWHLVDNSKLSIRKNVNIRFKNRQITRRLQSRWSSHYESMWIDFLKTDSNHYYDQICRHVSTMIIDCLRIFKILQVCYTSFHYLERTLWNNKQGNAYGNFLFSSFISSRMFYNLWPIIKFE